ncbi:MAG: response regulator [Thermoproteota archaeon]|jgi:CheY-like chemotaxis protein|nr:response regulator [Thermoproteota archaeon]
MNNSVTHVSQTQHQDERKKRIMTVDDEHDVVFCLREVLEDTELFEVEGFTDPQLALSGFRPGKYDLVILDIRMPKMDGLELYRRIKLLDRNVDICFLTAVNDLSEYRVEHPDITDEIERDKESCIIDKPAGTEQLIRKINEVIHIRIRKQRKAMEA